MKRLGHGAVVAVLLAGLAGGAVGWAKSHGEPSPDGPESDAARKAPELTAALEVPAAVPVGESFTVQYRLGNAGDARAEGVRFVLDLPASYFGRIVQEEEMVNRVEGDALEPGQQVPLTHTTLARVPGEARITVTVTAVNGRPATATATVRVLAPKLEVKIDGPAALGVRHVAKYTVTITNTGDLTARDVRGTTEFGSGMTVPYFFNANGVLYCGDPVSGSAWGRYDLKPGESQTHTIDGCGETPGVSVTRVTVTEKGGVKATAEHRTTVFRE